MKQRDIDYIEDFPRYGCYVASLASLAERHAGRAFTPAQFQEVYDEAVQFGYVLHNELPRSQPGWYRCYVLRPVGLANLLLERAGLALRVESMRRNNQPGPDFCLICYQTQWGYHFALADSAGKEVVNPDPELSVLGVDSYRVFQLEEEL